MSVREIKAYTITCTLAYGPQATCQKKSLGPFFAEYQSGVQIPEGWAYRTSHDCGLTGYTSHDLFCGDCIKEHGIDVG